MELIPRESYLSQINNGLKFVPIIVLIGARQVGKSSLLKMLASEESIIFDGQDIEHTELFQQYSTIENYLKINLNPDISGTIFIDEFQYITNISVILKLLVDRNPNLKIIVSGSSSLDIRQKVEESLAGRVRIIEVFSLSFQEYLLFKDKSLFLLYSRYSYDTELTIINKKILSLFNEYLIFGGLPRAALADKSVDKIEILDDIYKTYLLKDVRSYIRGEDFIAFNKLLKILASQIGNMLNIHKLSGTINLSYARCEEYLDILQQMYILRLLPPYVSNKRREITKMKKVFFLDIGLRNIIYNSFNDMEYRVDNGALFENYVYLELLKNTDKSFNFYYYRTKDGAEIDFIVNNHYSLIPIEVKFKNYDKPKKIRALSSFCERENLPLSYVVNRNLAYNYDGMVYVPGTLAGLLNLS